MDTAASDARLRELLDREELRELIYAYCSAVDRHDFERLRTLYHPDATDHHGRLFQGPAGAFIEALPAILEPMEIVSHNVTNVSLKLDGNRGEGEVGFFAFHRIRTPDGAQDMLLGGRYADRYERRAGLWKIAHRAVIADWIQVHEPSICDMRIPELEGSLLGSPDAGDPSYALFQLFRRGQR
jgi:ketosteroid isomerase-like protein